MGWHTDSSSAPLYGRVDLLTVVMHELGHILGYDHGEDSRSLMAASLAPGLRYLSATQARSATDGLFTSLGSTSLHSRGLGNLSLRSARLDSFSHAASSSDLLLLQTGLTRKPSPLSPLTARPLLDFRPVPERADRRRIGEAVQHRPARRGDDHARDEVFANLEELNPWQAAEMP